MPHPRRRPALPVAWLAAAAVAAIAVPALAADPPPHPTWPDNGVAQRRFPGTGMMFVENDSGRLRAWILSNATGPNVDAMDFFSGRRMRVKVTLEDDGHQDSEFTDLSGKRHDGMDQTFRRTAAGGLIQLPGINFDGETLRLNASRRSCSAQLTAVETHPNGAPSASRFLIVHTAGSQDTCPSGFLDSSVDTALDLDDGTILAAAGCFVFRLRKSDLSPDGSAPALRVIDRDKVKAAIDAAGTAPVADATAYLAKTLDLPMTSEASCK